MAAQDSPSPGGRRAVVFGEALIDVFPDRRVVAGAPLNVACHLAALGWEVELVTRLGADADGARVQETLRALGVGQALVEIDDELPTGVVSVAMDGTSHTFVIHGPSAWDGIAGPPALPAHDVFCYGSLAARSAVSRTTLGRLLGLSRAPLRVFDVNLRPPHVDVDALATGLAAATVVKVNGEELEKVADLLGFQPDAAGYFAAAPDLGWLCVTRGEEGAEVYGRSGEAWSAAPPPVRIVDSVGAGDAFVAAFVGSLGTGADADAALGAGIAVSSAVLQQRGGLPAARVV